MTNTVKEKIKMASKIGATVAVLGLILTALALLGAITNKVFSKDAEQDITITRHDERITAHKEILDRHDTFIVEQRAVSEDILDGIKDLKENPR